MSTLDALDAVITKERPQFREELTDIVRIIQRETYDLFKSRMERIQGVIKRHATDEDAMWFAYCFMLRDAIAGWGISMVLDEIYRMFCRCIKVAAVPYLGLTKAAIDHRFYVGDPAKNGRLHHRTISKNVPDAAARKILNPKQVPNRLTVTVKLMNEWANHPLTDVAPASKYPLGPTFIKPFAWASLFLIKVVRIEDWFQFPGVFKRLPSYVQTSVFNCLGPNDRKKLISHMQNGEADNLAFMLYAHESKPWVPTMKLLYPVASNGFKRLLDYMHTPNIVISTCVNELFPGEVSISTLCTVVSLRDDTIHTRALVDVIVRRIPLYQMCRSEFTDTGITGTFKWLASHKKYTQLFKNIAVFRALYPILPCEVINNVAGFMGHKVNDGRDRNGKQWDD